MNIRYVIPYALDKNLADAYNDEMGRAKEGEYLAFCDRDTILHLAKFGHIIHDIVAKYPDVHYFTCLTNRTNCQWQRLPVKSTNDIEYHKAIAEHQYKKWGNSVEDHTNDQLWSGHLMICKKDSWIPLQTRGLLGVDNEIHQNAINQGQKVYLMTGIYIYHYYSNFDGANGHLKRDKSHLL